MIPKVGIRNISTHPYCLSPLVAIQGCTTARDQSQSSISQSTHLIQHGGVACLRYQWRGVGGVGLIHLQDKILHLPFSFNMSSHTEDSFWTQNSEEKYH